MITIKKISSFEELKNRLAPLFKDEGLQLVLAFGSVVSQRVHKHSDIDLAFLFNKPVDILRLTNRVIRLLQTDNVDIVDLKRASPILIFSAAKYGRLLYERLPGVFNEFYSLAFRRYMDTEKLRNAQAMAIRHFLEARRLL
jgi:predicted nucleotidyltransferase